MHAALNESAPNARKKKNPPKRKDYDPSTLDENKNDLSEVSREADIDPFTNYDSDERGLRDGAFFALSGTGFQRPDERVREDVCLALERSVDFDATDIEVSAKDGMITLAGFVDDFPSKRAAENTAATIPGVRNITNQLFIRNTFGGEF